MNKQTFLAELRARLKGLPSQDAEERLGFYSEMIDDRMEEGLTEEDAIREIGSVDAIVSQIVADTPLSKIAKEKIKPRRKLRAWEIVLIVLGSPVWAPLLIAACAVALSLYAVLWSVIISLWAVFASLAACAVAFVPTGIALACNGHVTTGVALIGSSMILTGLAVFAFVGCKEATRGTVILTKKIAIGIKKSIMGKEKE